LAHLAFLPFAPCLNPILLSAAAQAINSAEALLFAEMLSSLLRPKKARRRVEEHAQFSSPYAERRHATADFTEDDGEDENTEDEDDQEEGEEGDGEEVIEEEDGDEDTPLLPIFSAAHLGISSHSACKTC
jgi:hypothetical protein